MSESDDTNIVGAPAGSPADMKTLIETIMLPLNILTKVSNWEVAKDLYAALQALTQSDAFLNAVSAMVDLFKKNPTVIPQPPKFVGEFHQQFMASGVWNQVVSWCSANGHNAAAIPSWLTMIFSVINWSQVLQLLQQLFGPANPVTPPTPPV